MEIEIKDLLKKIVNEEELPIKINVFNHIFVYTGDKRLQRFYKMVDQENYLFRDFVYLLNTKVKILEDRDFIHKASCKNFETYECKKLGGLAIFPKVQSVSKEAKEIPKKLNKQHFHKKQRQLANKINEIIDYIVIKE